MLESSAGVSRATQKEGKSGVLVGIAGGVQLCGLGLQSPRLPSSEAKGIYRSHESILLLLFDGLMRGV